MKPLGLSKQIIIIAILPALLVGIILSVYYTFDQLSFISNSQSKYGNFIVKEVALLTERALVNDELQTLRPILKDIASNKNVVSLRISDSSNHDIISIKNTYDHGTDDPMLHSLVESERSLDFTEPVLYAYDLPDGTRFQEKIAIIELTLSTRQATIDKTDHIVRSGSVTLVMMLLLSLFILRVSKNVISPIKSLISSVRNISAGDLDSTIDITSTGELGILESCINQMKNELKESRTDLEVQLDVYTEELQQTLEELEIRNAELDITRSKAIYANNAKSEFLANMSHEIRTPLSGIIGFTELLQNTHLSGQQKDYTNTIQKSSRSLLEIINDILDLSKIESGKTEITTSEFNLVDIIEDIINLSSPAALEKNIELFYRIDKGVPISIHSDPFRIHQILTNLIGNAIKFTDKGYVFLQVTAHTTDDTDTSVKFNVSDTGIGMNGDDKKKLFKAFTQADTSITRRFGGTGLGLVISRKLTLLMKGEIGFDSTENEGSTFWFSVPVTPATVDVTVSELANNTVALICNHFIAKQSFKNMFKNAQCNINDYTTDDFSNLTEIEKDNDIIVVFLGRKDINNEYTVSQISSLELSKPSLLIASTRSHQKLRELQQHVFDGAVFTSEKIERIKQKLISAVSKKTTDNEIENLDETTPAETDWSHINIMVVDDNKVNLRLAEILLHQNKARVTTARSGEQAVEFASMNSFDMIFMDLHMPGIDGYETTRKIRDITPGKQPVIIALTANALPHEKEKVLQYGMNGILIKPVSDSILRNVIHQWIIKEPIHIHHHDNGTSKSEAEIHAGGSINNDDSVFSINLAKEFTGNNEELAYELFEMLRAELSSYSDAITTAVKNKNLAELREQVHKLHGASRCCGTTELKKTSSHIENMIDQKIIFDIQKDIQPLMTAIKNVSEFQINKKEVSGL